MREVSAVGQSVWHLVSIRRAGDSVTELSESDSAKIRSKKTQGTGLDKDPSPDGDQFTVDDSYGRYRIVRQLGRGGFGQVLLANDPILDRPVAIKVPKHFQQLRPEVRSRFIEEGRSLAKLSHPAVVSVFDVGVSGQGQPFVVMEYVDGQSLSQRIKSQRLSLAESLEILFQVADGLKAMHQAQVVHRDLKPGNIVLDSEGRARIIDFGLALNDGIPLRQLGGIQEGTPAYMAPEQVRGLNHQLDGRTDIWSFGVTMYQMMTGRLPFGGRRTQDLGYRICSVDPLPLRQLNSAIPSELERICLRCLAKSMSNRYENVSDLLQELIAARQKLGAELTRERVVTTTATAYRSDGSQPHSDLRTPLTPLHGSTISNVMTHGLRAFTQRDADYFFELLPGQRDAQGMPETIVFWQQRLRAGANSPNQGFTVGLIYGPSGCGKTSFVCAGLLPRVKEEFEIIYLECDARHTESKLSRQLNQKIPELGSVELLEDKLRRLRLDTDLLHSKRLLLVMDQFEQWLRPPRQLQREALVEALRQLDGEKLSCLILVRDDYWMGITQLMRALDQRIQEGINAMAYPLFDRGHAEKVLTTFGQSMNRLPRDPALLTKSQRNFIGGAVKSFSRNGKVICVHLAMFAQMMRDRVWEAPELRRMGGWKGIGGRYLEETFSDPEAPRAMRLYLPEVSAILERLLPAGKRDIKGSMVSETELKQASNMLGRDDDFEQVLEILLNSTRLITQVDGASDSDSNRERYYQLSHDFLASPISGWLEKQRLGSWRGRAHLRLIELSNQWSVNNDIRFLPAAVEWATIILGVPWRIRSHHAKFIAAATKRILARWAITSTILLAVALVAIGLIKQAQRQTGTARADQLVAARSADLGNVLAAIKPTYSSVRPRLDKLLSQDQLSSDWRIYLARIQNRDRTAESLDRLLDRIDLMPDEEIPVVIGTLTDLASTAATQLESLFSNAKDPKLRARLATILLFLGRDQFARQVLSLGPDPTVRTLFIKHFGACAGDLTSIMKFVRDADDFDLECGLCAAVGRMSQSRMTAEERASWVHVFRDVYLNSPAAGSHSTAQWALVHWGMELPPLAPQPNPPIDKDWWVIEVVPGHALTFVRVPIGKIVTGASLPESFRRKWKIEIQPDAPKQIASFWICTQEVTCGLFQVYADSLAPGEQAVHVNSDLDSSAPRNRRRPIYGVEYLSIIKFCNWLSRQTNRSECFAIEDRSASLIHTATGIRLPLRQEWEYACQARANTLFPFGGLDQLDSLVDYSWHLSPELDPQSPISEGGLKMPNAWGIFDMLGNANEWCADGPPNDEDARYLLGGHNMSALEHLFAGFPDFDLREVNFQFQGIRLVLPDE